MTVELSFNCEDVRVTCGYSGLGDTTILPIVSFMVAKLSRYHEIFAEVSWIDNLTGPSLENIGACAMDGDFICNAK